MKRIISLFLVFSLLSCCIMPVRAAQKDDIELQYDKILDVYAAISLNQTIGIVTCTGTITAKNTYPVKVLVQLQVWENNNWRTVTSWTNTGTLSASVSKPYAVYSGFTYRVYVTGYVYDSNGNIVESGVSFHSVYYPSN